jgi:membrane associated rhomboid family serine protease
MRTPRALTELPVLTRYVIVGGLVAGIAGCAAGLIIGLKAYAPTAWFATFEVGVPTAIIGAIIGLLVGSIVLTYHRVHRARGIRRAHSAR